MRLFDELAKIEPGLGIEEWREAIRAAARRVGEAETQEQQAYREQQRRACRLINDQSGMMREMGFGLGWRPLDPLDPYAYF